MEPLDDIVERIREAAKQLDKQPSPPDARRQLDAAVKIAADAVDSLDRRYEQTRSKEDLDHLVEVLETLLGVVPRGRTTSWAYFAGTLSTSLIERFQRMGPGGSWGDADRAVELGEKVVEDLPRGGWNWRGSMVNLARIREARYLRNGRREEIERAVREAEEGVDGIGNGIGVGGGGGGGGGEVGAALGMLTTTAVLLGRLFELTREVGVVDRGIGHAEVAVGLGGEGGREGAFARNTLGRLLAERFEQVGDVGDVERAIAVLLESEAKTEPGTMDHSLCLEYLGLAFGLRFEAQGDVEDLNSAVYYSERVVGMADERHMERPGDSYNLANRLAQRAQYTGEVEDISRSIKYGLELSERIDDPERAMWLEGLSRFYGIRFTLPTGPKSPEDLDQALYWIREAIKLNSQRESLEMYGPLAITLSNLLHDRYKEQKALGDLDEAADVLRAALGKAQARNPVRATLNYVLGTTMHMRYLRTQMLSDLEQSRKSFQESWDSENAAPTLRVDAAARAAEIFVHQALELKKALNVESDSKKAAQLALEIKSLWAKASEDLDHAISHLHTLSPQHLQNDNKQKLIQKFAGLAASAASVALNADRGTLYALQQLELGRGVISGLLLDLRTDISALREKYPDWANEFCRLRDLLDSGGSRPMPTLASSGASFLRTPWEIKSEARRRAEKEFDDLVKKIRHEPGFERFLLPPSEEQLMKAADPDPVVVVNVSDLRCDAFIVTKDGITLLGLPKLTLNDVQEKARQLQRDSVSLGSTLPWLWDVLVSPVLEALGFTNLPSSADSHWPHMWWIPVGPLNFLPVHAAGYHGKQTGKTALDRVISSYGSSIKSLLAARPTRKHNGSAKALLVSMETTPGHAPLPNAKDEVAMVKGLCPSLNSAPIQPPERRRDILDQLGSCDIFHFAGHGISDQLDPSQSRLLLDDWEKQPLTAGDLRDLKLQESAPFLAYLSACSTGANEVLSLIDEGIHLGYACQLAGFRHVIGALWTVSDPFCVDVARRFYQTIRDEGKNDEAVHRGLHFALRELRNVQVGNTNRGGGVDGHGEELDGQGDEEVEGDQAGIDGSEERKGRVGGIKPMNWFWVPYVHFGA